MNEYPFPFFWMAAPNLTINVNHIVWISINGATGDATIRLSVPLPDGDDLLRMSRGKSLDTLYALITKRNVWQAGL